MTKTNNEELLILRTRVLALSESLVRTNASMMQVLTMLNKMLGLEPDQISKDTK